MLHVIMTNIHNKMGWFLVREKCSNTNILVLISFYRTHVAILSEFAWTRSTFVLVDTVLILSVGLCFASSMSLV